MIYYIDRYISIYIVSYTHFIKSSSGNEGVKKFHWRIDYYTIMKCIYTDIETDNMLNELQKDKTFILSKFFKLAVKQVYNSNHSENKELLLQKKIADYELSKAELELYTEELNKEKLSKLKEVAEKEKEREESIEHFSNYFLKQKEAKELDEQEAKKLSKEWAIIVVDKGASKSPLVVDYIQNMKGGKNNGYT